MEPSPDHGKVLAAIQELLIPIAGPDPQFVITIADKVGSPESATFHNTQRDYALHLLKVALTVITAHTAREAKPPIPPFSRDLN